MKKRIRRSLEEKKQVEGALPYTVHEDWDLKEKLSKFLVNSCNVYAWFGYEYRLPFYDREYMEFFRDLPFAFKKNKALYDHHLREGLFAQLGINMMRESQPSEKQQKVARVKGRIKNFIPGWAMQKQPPRDDAIFYREITARLVRDMQKRDRRIRIQGGAYNSLLVQWYLEYLNLKYPGKDIST
jgi:asparagine synthase (glutamine-hydrolysing)